MKTNAVPLTLIPAFLSLAWTCAAAPLEEAEAQFREGQFDAGLQTVFKALESSPDPRAKAPLLARLARLSEESVGDLANAIERWQQAADAGYRPDAQGDTSPQQEIARLRPLLAAFAKANGPLTAARTPTADARVLGERIATLTALAEDYRNNPSVCQIYHVLGLNRAWQNRHREACDAFATALALKPAMYLQFPAIVADRTHSERALHRARAAIWIWVSLAALTLAIAVPLFRVPWKRLSKRHNLAQHILLLVLAWLAVFFVAAWIFCKAGIPPPSSSVLAGSRVSSWFNGSGGPYLNNLFYLGLVGLVGAYLIAIGMAKVRSPRLAFTAALLLSAAFMVALVSLYINVNYTENDLFERNGTGGFRTAAGTFYFLPQADHDGD